MVIISVLFTDLVLYYGNTHTISKTITVITVSYYNSYSKHPTIIVTIIIIIIIIIIINIIIIIIVTLS